MMDIKKILQEHALWAEDLAGGVQADLNEADLQGADLHWVDLNHADLRGADLRQANLRGADLRHADLRYADFRGAFTESVCLDGADLRYAIGNGKEVNSMRAEGQTIVWTADVLAIGGLQLPIHKWWSLPDEGVDPNMRALWEWWKPVLRQVIEGDLT